MERQVDRRATHQSALGAEQAGVPQPGPWSVRAAPSHRRGRAALEVYEHGELLDVVVASTLGSGLLRGARRCVRGGQPTGFAWGRLPSDRSLPTVTFTGSRLGRLSGLRQPARVVTLAGEFWLAWVEGPCGGVAVQHGDGAVVRLRAGRA